MRDAPRVVESGPDPDEGAAVMTDQTEPIRPDGAHDTEDVACHGGFRVGLGRDRSRLVAGAVAAQIGHDDLVGVSELAGDVAPHEVRLREAVEQDGGGPAAAHGDVELDAAVAGDCSVVEAVDGHVGHGSDLSMMVLEWTSGVASRSRYLRGRDQPKMARGGGSVPALARRAGSRVLSIR